jgi:hypothetical protein
MVRVYRSELSPGFKDLLQSSGAYSQQDKGDPVTGVSAPVAGSIFSPVTLLNPLLVAWRKLPEGSTPNTSAPEGASLKGDPAT